uniref:Uncharacterized protein n=1 Tax=Timema bartmani TaxID=61472 RepID=A0A7R9HZY9_9NEOP|nr:unnamed protein product [Timema bartmani]
MGLSEQDEEGEFQEHARIKGDPTPTHVKGNSPGLLMTCIQGAAYQNVETRCRRPKTQQQTTQSNYISSVAGMDTGPLLPQFDLLTTTRLSSGGQRIYNLERSYSPRSPLLSHGFNCHYLRCRMNTGVTTQVGGPRLVDYGSRPGGALLGDSGSRPGGALLGDSDSRPWGALLGNSSFRPGSSLLWDSDSRPGGVLLGDSGSRPGSSLLGDSGSRPGSSLLEDSGSRPGGALLGDSGSRLGILTRSKQCVNSLVCVRWMLVVFRYSPQMRYVLVKCFLLGDNKLSLLAPRSLLRHSPHSSVQSLRAKPERSVPRPSQSGSQGPRSANLSCMLKVISPVDCAPTMLDRVREKSLLKQSKTTQLEHSIRDPGLITGDRDAGSILGDRDPGLITGDKDAGSILGLPSTRDSITHPVHVYEGDDALITCVVRDVGDNNIMWKKEDRERHIMRVLTADETRVTSDKRFDVLHDGGGDVWVLVIRTAKPTDSGVYVCEVNSKPIVRSFHKLSVLSRALLPPDNATGPLTYETQSGDAPKNHNYTDCCVSSNVSSNCFGFCNIQSILEGNTGKDPENCEADFPAIVKCMADGRNHIPCCIQEGVPDICQDVCRGEYTTITENIKTHFSCSAYTEQTLACIMEGVEILPSPPLNLEVEALSDSSFKVSWQPPQVNKATLTEYLVNVTALLSFDQDEEVVSQEEQDSYAAAADSYALAAARLRGTGEDGNDTGIALKPPTTDVLVVSDLKPPTTNVKVMGETLQVKVPGTYNFTLVSNLKPFTMYEIFVTALNIHGSSLPSYSVRALTLTPGRLKSSQVAEAPELPDIRSCCVNKGITHPTCVDKLCDPALSDITEVTDLMICAPWAADTFSCLTNGVDHTGCCKARGLPQQCQELCAGNITQIDFSYFKCLKYMNDYTNCLLQGYGVLPSAPTQLHISNIDVNFVILHWEAPLTLGDTVKHYNLHYRQMGLEDMSYKSISMVHSPYILENLISDSMYEVFVEAVNIHGVGEPSSRAVFQTSSQLDQEKIEEASAYNLTACCLAADLTAVCMPLCSYNANMSDIKSLAGMCAGELNKLVRCGAGGRNHGDCCTRRGVPSSCLSICSGVIVDSLIVTATSCIPFIGNIVQCFEEGTGILPGPVTELHATSVTNTSVTLQWEPPTDSNASDYVIHYKKVDNITMHETVLAIDSTQNATSTISVVQGLDSGALYSFFVVSRNIHGTSLPSSVLMINVTNTDLGEKGVPSLTSPPHSLAVSAHSATWVTISWQPPEFSHPSEKLVYKLYHKSTADSSFQTVETSVTSHMVEGLSPNTQYIIYVTAVSKNGQSLPSETLIAWTDPAYPAFVEVHILQRAMLGFHGTTIGPNIERVQGCIASNGHWPNHCQNPGLTKPPTVHPINLVMEGSSMTILCIAMGTPMPTISLYISGRLVRQETTRHMVTVVHNVTKDMDQISCYADNGYGTPMQASRKITISPSGITMAALGDSVVLECQVDAHPEPKMLFWRDQNGRVPVIQGGKYDINNMKAKDLLLGPGQVYLPQTQGSLSTADINPILGDYRPLYQ